MDLSFVIPVYNERETLEPLAAGILKQTVDRSVEVVFVDDGSTDGSGAALDAIAAQHPEIRVIHFGGNRGKTAALSAGFEAITGDIVITMDSDLQDDPAEIPAFLDALGAGEDMVCGWKEVRQDPMRKRMPSRVFNGFVSWLFGVSIHDVNCGYKAMRLEVAKSLVGLDEGLHRLMPVIAANQGYSVNEIAVHHRRREHGRSKYGAARFWHGIRDVAKLWWRLRTGG